MARYKVIKAHDGMREGEVKTLAPSSITAYMVANGYWVEVIDKPKARTRTKASK